MLVDITYKKMSFFYKTILLRQLGEVQRLVKIIAHLEHFESRIVLL